VEASPEGRILGRLSKLPSGFIPTTAKEDKPNKNDNDQSDEDGEAHPRTYATIWRG